MKPIPWNAKLWKASVTQFLEFLNPLIAGLGRSERRVAATRYVEGLLMRIRPANPCGASAYRLPVAFWQDGGVWD